MRGVEKCEGGVLWYAAVVYRTNEWESEKVDKKKEKKMRLVNIIDFNVTLCEPKLNLNSLKSTKLEKEGWEGIEGRDVDWSFD